MSDDDLDFHHPYTPYKIQEELMRAVYDCIDQGKVGVFESPTGTGKSLSLLCASLTWLRNHKRSEFNATIGVGKEDDDEPQWIRDHARATRKHNLLHKRNELEKRLEDVRRREEKIRKAGRDGHRHKRVKTDRDSSTAGDEAQFLLDDYNSDDHDAKRKAQIGSDGLSDVTRALLKKATGESELEDDEHDDDELKILICSRTHSQLSQLVGELNRIRIPSAFPSEHDTFPVEQVKQLSLGSRKNLCINDKVLALDNATSINERCLELQESKTTAAQKCRFVPNKENEGKILDFKYNAISKPRDIEDLADLGRSTEICPYYASRSAIAPAEVIALPYPLLLQKSAREALGLSVRDRVVIIDEAHNLVDAVTGIYSAEITLDQLDVARRQLMVYLQKFRNKLAGKNRVYVTQTVRLLDSLKTFLDGLAPSKSDTDGLVQSGQLLSGPGADQVNIHKLQEYLRISKLARKIQGYGAHVRQASTSGMASAPATERTSPALSIFEHFIACLANPAKEGRFLWFKGANPGETRLKYLLVDPSEHFREIVQDARAVVLIGGTMSPIEDYKLDLFPFVSEDKVTSLSCGHVIPKSNLFVSAVTRTVGGMELDFTFRSRNSEALIVELGKTICSLVAGIPDGVIIFFPSYPYLENVLEIWRKPYPLSLSRSAARILDDIQSAKAIHIDARSSDTDAILAAYTASISSPATSGGPQGAVLFSVIGGRLSEGINFSDQLGRCVMVVGLPYPNPNSAEWKAKMEHVETRAAERAAGITSGEPATPYVQGAASREYADNVCMRAVNQAIGRAIRHRHDWAGILLLDRRYALPRIRQRLPAWMKESIEPAGESGKRFRDLQRAMEGFYGGKLAEDRSTATL